MQTSTTASATRLLRLSIVAWLAGGAGDPPALAEEIVPLTSAELLARLRNNPRIEVQRARIDRSRAEAIAAGVLENPSLGFQREDVASAAEHSATVELPLQI